MYCVVKPGYLLTLATVLCVSPPPPLTAGSRELDRYGLSSVVDQDMTDVEIHKMFESLFHAILDYRLKEDAFSRVRRGA